MINSLTKLHIATPLPMTNNMAIDNNTLTDSNNAEKMDFMGSKVGKLTNVRVAVLKLLRSPREVAYQPREGSREGVYNPNIGWPTPQQEEAECMSTSPAILLGNKSIKPRLDQPDLSLI